MSLAVLADHMASKGRGPDSMLIHMSPREVQGLQALAEHHGGTLTINPDTGLPEANFLEKLLPTIIGAGISYFTGMDPMTAAAMVGGVETARTGDFGKGISAGLQAYSGASFTSNLSEMGSAAIGAESAASGLTMSPELLAEFGGDLERGISAKDLMLQQQVTDRMAAATPFEKLSYGAEAFKNNPLASLKANAMPIAGAFGPAILAEMSAKSNMPQTVTKPGMIAPYASFGGQFVAGSPYQATPTRAAGGGLMGMDDGGYGPGQLDFTQKSEPVVRMAKGGVPGYAIGGTVAADLEKAYAAKDYSKVQDIVSANQVSQADIQNQWKGLDTSGLAGLGVNLYNPEAEALFKQAGSWEGADKIRDDAANASNAAMWAKQAADRDAANLAASTSSGLKFATGQGQTADQYYSTIGNQFNELTGYGDKYANATDAQLDAAAKEAEIKYGVSYADFMKGIGKSGGSLASQYAIGAGNMGLSGLNTNINAWIAKANADPRFKALTPEQQRAEAVAAMGTVNMNDADVMRATGKTLAELFPKKELVCGPGFKKSIDGLTCVPDTTVITQETSCPTGFHYDPVLKQCVKNLDATQTTTTNVSTPTSISTADKSSLPVGISGAGVTTINPNGTVTTRPDLSLEMQDVRDAYTAGGGSLGVNKKLFAPTTYKEIEDRYKLTGGSKQAMDYLTGKTKYNPVPYTEDGQISKSYAESVMKIPVASSSKMYIFKNGKYEINPEYAIPTYDKDGKKSLNLTNADVKTFMDKKPSADTFYTWATTNNLSPEQIALASDRPINEISKLFTGAKDLVGDDGKIDQTKVDAKTDEDIKTNWDEDAYLKAYPDVAAELKTGKSVSGQPVQFTSGYEHWLRYGKDSGVKPITKKAADGGLMKLARGGMSQQFDLGGYSDGGRLLRGPGDGVSDSIPATIGNKRPARLADGEFVVPARIVSELGNGSTEAGARKLYAMMDRVQSARRGTVGKGRVAKNSRSEKYLPA